MPGVVLEVINCMKNGAVAIALQDNRLGLGADMAERIQVRASKSASSPDREDISTVQKTTMLPRPSVTTLKLQDAAIGSTLRVVSYEPTGREYKRKLLAMGLTPGTEVVVKRHAPLGDPIEVEVRGFRLSLRKDEAAALILESIEGVGS